MRLLCTLPFLSLCGTSTSILQRQAAFLQPLPGDHSRDARLLLRERAGVSRLFQLQAGDGDGGDGSTSSSPSSHTEGGEEEEFSFYASNQDREYEPWDFDLNKSPMRWQGQTLVPPKGGAFPGDPDAKKYNVTLIDSKTGESYSLDVAEDRYIFFAFEEAGIKLPIRNIKKMCRNGCCTTCTVRMREGDVEMDPQIGLVKEMTKNGYRLSCVSMPRSDVVAEFQDEDEVYVKQWAESFEKGKVDFGIPIEDD
uniref:2Fe-2S ferredoxin-type domain-containing protein n=1 Tax=Chromera velia CCMP2878 TaxID=1169474 RepID=A0A0G4HZN2_9ALVE|eukprot:Cvel_34051.t1-p1 / transcript=Cvel_34051.t1 / gene=Cvel_34051 / organism=Chromera_velia_CCMP2878 / gene_product=Ferredoxin, putative / transcript_product=Ferredoxin, putative / location=Cvel_scaffold5721:1195-1947(+) / protein_length=251 / sequence_SO=supercontig / SO=protein_coding / is_pseudo=false